MNTLLKSRLPAFAVAVILVLLVLASILHEGRRFGPEDPNPTSCHDIASA